MLSSALPPSLFVVVFTHRPFLLIDAFRRCSHRHLFLLSDLLMSYKNSSLSSLEKTVKLLSSTITTHQGQKLPILPTFTVTIVGSDLLCHQNMSYPSTIASLLLVFHWSSAIARLLCCSSSSRRRCWYAFPLIKRFQLLCFS